MTGRSSRTIITPNHNYKEFKHQNSIKDVMRQLSNKLSKQKDPTEQTNSKEIEEPIFDNNMKDISGEN